MGATMSQASEDNVRTEPVAEATLDDVEDVKTGNILDPICDSILDSSCPP